MTTRTLLFVFAFLLVVSLAHAGDERSIKNLAKALTGLSSDVDPAEAQALSYTAHTTARRLKKEYRVALNPEFTVFLYNVGLRKRGWCGHWAQDIGAELIKLEPKTLVLHWGEAYPNTTSENNALVVTARNQRFEDGILDRRLAQGRSIILVSGDKRRRVRNGTTLRPFRNHHVERKHEMERVAAVLLNGRGEAENSQRVSLNRSTADSSEAERCHLKIGVSHKRHAHF